MIRKLKKKWDFNLAKINNLINSRIINYFNISFKNIMLNSLSKTSAIIIILKTLLNYNIYF